MATNYAIQSLINDGADAMTNMYDVYIKFPGATDTTMMTVRASAFDIPEAAVGTYDVSYKGNKMKKVKSEINFERKFSMEFRTDAYYNIHDWFLNWHKYVANPATGGVANMPAALGEVDVYALDTPFISAKSDVSGSILGNYKTTDQSAEFNTTSGSYRHWQFTGVWVEKVGEPKFKTDGADAMKFTVDFNFQQMPKFPGYDADGDDSGSGE